MGILTPPVPTLLSINCTHFFLNCLTAGAVWVCVCCMCVRPLTLYCLVIVSVVVYWFGLVTVVNLWMLWLFSCLADNPDMTQIEKKWKSFWFLCWCLIELFRVWARAVSQGQSNTECNKEKNLVDFKDYLSMACLLVQRNRADPFLTFLKSAFFFLFLAWMGRASSFRRTHILHWPQ